MTLRVLASGAIGLESTSTGRPDSPEPPMIDEQQFQILYRRTAGEWVYIARVLGNAAHADGILQESYLRLVRTPPPTTDQQQCVRGCSGIASHLIVDHWRRTRKEVEQPDDFASTPAATGPDPSLRVDMAEQLSPQQRQMMWLAYVEGADHREIADALDVQPGSVRVLLHRARRKLAQSPRLSSDVRQREARSLTMLWDQPCEHEEAVRLMARRIARGAAPVMTAMTDETLRAHAVTCQLCQETLAVGAWMQQLATASISSAPLPDPQDPWKAELLRRWGAERRATSAINTGEQMQVGLGLAAAGGLLLWDAGAVFQRLRQARQPSRLP